MLVAACVDSNGWLERSLHSLENMRSKVRFPECFQFSVFVYPVFFNVYIFFLGSVCEWFHTQGTWTWHINIYRYTSSPFGGEIKGGDAINRQRVKSERKTQKHITT